MTVAIVAVVSVAIFVTAATVIAWPLLRGDRVPDEVVSASDQHRRQVDDDLQRTLAAIKEIEFDHASGHLSDEDFSTLDADERTKAIELLRVRDGLGAKRPPAEGDGD